MKFLYGLLCVATLFSQSRIEVYYSDSGTKFRQFELELIRHVVDLYLAQPDIKDSVDYIPVKNFHQLLDTLSVNGNGIERLSISSISYTKERSEHYQFTKAYMYNKVAVLGDGSEQYPSDSKQRVGYITKSTQEIYLDDLKDEYELLPYYSLKTREDDFKAKKVDYILSNYVYKWAYNLDTIRVLNHTDVDKYVVAFPKNSHIYTKFNTLFSYFLQSPKFYNLIRKYFGEEGTDYFNRFK